MKITIAEKVALIDKYAMYSIDGLKFPVRILDVKESYGRVLVKIKPFQGSGEKWTPFEKISMEGVTI